MSGSWIDLEPVSETDSAELAELDTLRANEPAMGTGFVRDESPFGPPMFVRDKQSARIVGIMENKALPASVSVVLVSLHPIQSRPVFSFEAVSLYISHLFDSGARLVSAEVLDFNVAMLGLLRKVKLEPRLRLREHAYVAGAFHDLLVYSWDRGEWVEKVVDRYRHLFPGGGRRPAAFGKTRRS